MYGHNQKLAKPRRSGKVIKTVPEKDLVICSPVVFGFDLGTKLWVRIPVDGISEIKWIDGALNTVIIPDTTKRLVREVSRGVLDGKCEPIQLELLSRGRGVTFLLHGPPGTGKSMTAAAVAEELCVPIIRLGASELGHEPASVDEIMTTYITLTQRWKAILLIDEVDVYLQRPDYTSFHSN